jgi:hypothetical protein
MNTALAEGGAAKLLGPVEIFAAGADCDELQGAATTPSISVK